MSIEISVVVPVHNVGQLLIRCVRSLEDQTFHVPYEIILVDDGSTDHSGQLCDQLSAEYGNILTIHQKNAGLGEARNTGLRKANGKYVCFVDSDDSVAPEYLEELHRGMLSGAGMTVCGYYREAQQSEKTVQDEKRAFDNSGISLSETLAILHNSTLMYVVWNKMYTTSAARNVLFSRYKRLEDVDFNYRYLLQNPSCLVIDKTLYHYQIFGKDRVTLSTMYPEGFWEKECIPVYKLGCDLCCHLDKMNEKSDDTHKLRSCIELHLLSSLGGIILDTGLSKGRKYIKKIISEFNSFKITRKEEWNSIFLDRLLYFCIKHEWTNALVILSWLYKIKRRVTP